MPTKSLAEIENDIAALQTQATKMRNDAKALAKPRLDEIKAQVETLLNEAVALVKNNAIYEFDIVLEPRVGSYGVPTRLNYSYSEWSVSGDNAATGWQAS